MLREVKHNHIRPRLLGFQFTTTVTPSVTANVGSNDLSTLTRGGAGLPVATFKEGTNRTPILVCTNGGAVAAGGYSYLAAASTATQIQPTIANAGGTAVDGTCEALALTYHSSDANIFRPQIVFGSKRRSVIFAAQIQTDGSVLIGKKDISCTRTGTGAYTITFMRAFGQTPVVIVTSVSTAGARAPRVDTKSVSGCTITVADNTGTSQDSKLNIVVLGCYGRDDHGQARNTLENTQRFPRIVAGQITWTAGTPAFTINPLGFTSVVDTGTGDVTFSYAATFDRMVPFKREPIVVATARGALRAQIAASSATSLEIQTRNAGGVLTDATTVDFIAVGSNDATEY